MIRSFCTKSKGYFVNNDNFRQQAFVSLAFRKDLCYDKIRYGNRPKNGGTDLTNTQKGMLAGFSGNFIFGLSFLFSTRAFSTAELLLKSTGAMSGADVPVVLSARFIFAFLLMTALLPVLKIKLSFRGKPVFKLILLGIFQPVVYFIGESFGLKQTGIVVSSVMIALVPVLCQIFSALVLHEPPKFLQVLFCVLSVGGVVVVTVGSSDGGGKTYLSGLIFLTVAVVSAVAFNILSRDLAKDFTPFERTYFMFIDAAIFFTVYALVATRFQPLLIVKPLLIPEYVISILYLGGLSSIFAYLMVNYSNTYLPLTRSTVFSSVITVVSTTAGFCVDPHSFSVTNVIACLVILVGIWGVQRFAETPKQ